MRVRTRETERLRAEAYREANRDTKTIRVSQMTTWAWEKVLMEVGKCRLLCACCHRTRTQNHFRGAA